MSGSLKHTVKSVALLTSFAAFVAFAGFILGVFVKGRAAKGRIYSSQDGRVYLSVSQSQQRLFRRNWYIYRFSVCEAATGKELSGNGLIFDADSAMNMNVVPVWSSNSLRFAKFPFRAHFQDGWQVWNATDTYLQERLTLQAKGE